MKPSKRIEQIYNSIRGNYTPEPFNHPQCWFEAIMMYLDELHSAKEGLK